MAEHLSTERIPWLRVYAWSAATALLLGVVGVGPTAALAGTPGIWAGVFGLGIALLGSLAGSAPTLAYLRKPPREHAIGILLGLGVRFAVTIALTVAVWLMDLVPETALVLWVGLGQFGLLAVDVWSLTGLLRQAAAEGRA